MKQGASVSVVMAAANAEQFLYRSLGAIAHQDYSNIAEVIVAAGDIATANAAREGGAIVVDNPSGRTPVGLNIAIARGTGEVIVRVDAHSVLPREYVSRVVEVMEQTRAEVVGGSQVPVGQSFWQTAIATAMSSPIGAGNARYRIGGEAGPVDTVYLGAFRRSTLDELGGYDERYLRHQDFELNHRIRDRGGQVWFDPGLRVEYQPRSSLIDVARQYFGYGTWKRRFSRNHPGALQLRHWAPPVLVVGLTLAIAGSSVWPGFLAIPLGYAAGMAMSGLIMIPSKGVAALGVPLALMTMHLAWGLGFLFGHTNDV